MIKRIQIFTLTVKDVNNSLVYILNSSILKAVIL